MTDMNLTEQKPEIDKTWTLFLDRDGVINVESVGSYITSWEEFRFLDGVKDAIKSLSGMFGRVVIVSNQRGVGRGIMSIDALREINTNLRNTVANYGGRIDKIYNCIAISDEDRNRKPNTGMGMQAQEDFPEIDFRKSIMVGNSMSDMEFGKRLSMHTIFLTTKHEAVEMPNDLVDEQYASLQAWAKTMEHAAEAVG